jgi:choline transport protein
MDKTVELRTLDDEVLHHRGKGSIAESKPPTDFDRDRYDLARVGKKQVLKASVLEKSRKSAAD